MDKAETMLSAARRINQQVLVEKKAYELKQAYHAQRFRQERRVMVKEDANSRRRERADKEKVRKALAILRRNLKKDENAKAKQDELLTDLESESEKDPKAKRIRG